MNHLVAQAEVSPEIEMISVSTTGLDLALLERLREGVSRLPSDVIIARANSPHVALLGLDSLLIQNNVSAVDGERNLQTLLANEVSKRSITGQDSVGTSSIADYKPSQPEFFVRVLDGLADAYSKVDKNDTPVVERILNAYGQAGVGRSQDDEYRVQTHDGKILTASELKKTLLQLDLDQTSRLKAGPVRQTKLNMIAALADRLGEKIVYEPGMFNAGKQLAKSGVNTLRDHSKTAVTAAVIMGTATSVMPAAAAVEVPKPSTSISSQATGLQIEGSDVLITADPTTIDATLPAPTSVSPSETIPQTQTTSNAPGPSTATSIVPSVPTPITGSEGLGPEVIITSPPSTQTTIVPNSPSSPIQTLPFIPIPGHLPETTIPILTLPNLKAGTSQLPAIEPLTVPDTGSSGDSIQEPGQSAVIPQTPAVGTSTPVSGQNGESSPAPNPTNTQSGGSSGEISGGAPSPITSSPGSTANQNTVPSTPSAPEVSTAAPTIQQQTANIISQYASAIKANSISVLQGGAVQSNNPKDQMPPSLIEDLNLMGGYMQKILNGDQTQINTDAANWTNNVISSDQQGSFTPAQHQLITALEATASALDASGDHQDAAITRALGVYQLNNEMIITEPNLYAEFSTPTPSTSNTAPNFTETTNSQNETFSQALKQVIVHQIEKSRNSRNYVGRYTPDQIADMIFKYSASSNIPPEVITAQLQQESGFREGVTSTDGWATVGIAQFMKSTWDEQLSEMGIASGDRTDADLSIRVQVHYMQGLYNEAQHKINAGVLVGDPVKFALAAYNWGMDSVLAFASQNGGRLPTQQDVGTTYMRNGTVATVPQQVVNYVSQITKRADRFDQRAKSLLNSQNTATAPVTSNPAPNPSTSTAPVPTPNPNVAPAPQNQFTDNPTISISPTALATIRARGNQLVQATINSETTGDYTAFETACPRNDPQKRCSDLCDHVAAYLLGNSHSGHPDAREHRQDMAAEGLLHNGSDMYEPAIGSEMYWGTSGQGHTAIYAGNGLIYTTDLGNHTSGVTGGVYLAKASDVSRLWGLQYMGWAIDPALTH